LISEIAILFVVAVLVATLVFLLFPQSYQKVRRHFDFQLDAVEFDDARPNRYRQLAMMIIALIGLVTLLESAKCTRSHRRPDCWM